MKLAWPEQFKGTHKNDYTWLDLNKSKNIKR